MNIKPYRGKINRALSRRLKQSYGSGSHPAAVRVIVQFKRECTPARLRELRRHLGREPFPVHRRLPLINAVSSRISETCLRKLCGWHGTRKVYMDRVRSAVLDIAAPSVGAAAVRKKAGLTGKGVNIAVIDTGVYPHPDLVRPSNRIVAFKDFVNGRSRPYDDNGHGTHVAGDAAGNGWSSRGKYKGPAPQAGIVAVKTLDQNGNGYDLDIIKGIEWCVANRRKLKLRILSMSLGGEALDPCSQDPLCQAVERAVRAGIAVVVAAGNSGPGSGTIESPGTSPSAITVGAVDDRRTVKQSDDRIAWFSSRGPAKGGKTKPDLTAPGVSIISLRAPGSALDRQLPQQRVGRRYFTLSGTSMSAPIVAGAAALLLQRYPTLTPRQVKSLLKRHAYRLPLRANAGGSGEANVRFLISTR